MTDSNTRLADWDWTSTADADLDWRDGHLDTPEDAADWAELQREVADDLEKRLRKWLPWVLRDVAGDYPPPDGPEIHVWAEEHWRYVGGAQQDLGIEGVEIPDHWPPGVGPDPMEHAVERWAREDWEARLADLAQLDGDAGVER